MQSEEKLVLEWEEWGGAEQERGNASVSSWMERWWQEGAPCSYNPNSAWPHRKCPGQEAGWGV